MKRFTKVLISMLLLVSMLAGYIPALDFTTTANAAASEPTYRYELVKSTNLVPGETYLIGDKGSGTVSIVGSPDSINTVATSSNRATKIINKSVTASSSGIIESFEGAENYEWTWMKGNARSETNPSNVPATYMLQNVKTGGYLYNDVYEAGGNGGTLRVTSDCLTDSYPKQTHMVFNSQAAVTKYATLAGQGAYANWNGVGRLDIGYNNSTYVDPQVRFNFGSIKGYAYATSVGHAWRSYGETGLFWDSTNNFRLLYWSNLYNQNWTAYSESVDTSSAVVRLRFDPGQDVGNQDQISIQDVFLSTNAHSVTALSYYRACTAWFGQSGYYPSQRYPFCQFVAGTPDANGATVLGNFSVDATAGAKNGSFSTFAEMYYYCFASGDICRSWNARSNSIYFYKKVEVTPADSVWEPVTSADEIQNHMEVLLVSRSTDGTGAIIKSNASGVVAGTRKTVSGNQYTSTVDSYDIWRVQKCGDYFYLMNKDGNYLASDKTTPTSLKLYFAADTGTYCEGSSYKTYTYGTRYKWQYDMTNKRLVAYHTNQIADEAASPANLGLNDSAKPQINSDDVYLYKRVYHEHKWDAGVETTAATCTSTGVRTYTCGVTSNVWTFPAGNSFNPIAVGYQGDNFDVEMDIKIIATGGRIYYFSEETARSPVFSEGSVGVGSATIPGNYNKDQWYHVKWDASSDGKTTIYVDDVNVGTVDATPTLYNEEGVYKAYWQWDKISIDNLKIGNYFCDMENGGIGGQGQLISDTMVEGCGATRTETIPKLEHRWNEGVTTLEPTCTVDGVKTYTCDGTNYVWTFPEKQSYNPVTVGSQGSNFDVEMDIRINASGGCLDHYREYNPIPAIAPMFSETAVGVGDITRPGSFNLNQWYHVKWDASDDGSTAIYVDGVYYGTVAATPTLSSEAFQTYWRWDKISIDNLKVGTYFCDMESGLVGSGGHGQLVSDTIVAGCGTTKTEAIPATGHDYTTAGVTPPTCTEQGYTTYTCSKCGYSYNDNYTDALGHDFTSTVYRYNGNGTHSAKCSRCDAYSAAVACTLSYTSDGNSVDGTHSATCSVCGGTVTAAHSWEETNRTGDCGHDGYIEYRCNVCGETRRETVTATGEHNYVDTVTEATCTEQGYTTHVCSNCNDTYVDNYVAALGHDYLDDDGWTVVTYPTFDAPGSEERVCRRCGAVEQREIPQLTQTTLAASNETTTPGGTATVTFKLTGNPGIWSQNFVIYFPKALTVESVTASTAVYSNYDMGQTSTGIIPTTNPRMLEYFNAAKIPDSSKYKAIAYYTDNGNEDSHADGLIVSVTFRVPEAGKCLKRYDVNLFGVFADNGNDAVNWNGDSINPAIVYKNGGIDIPEGIAACEKHEYGEWTVTTAPTCTSKGTQERICSVCGYIDVAEIDMLPHTWVEATCTEAGYCSVCGTVNPDAPALGHLWGDWITVREASGISPEIQKRHCGRCSAFETREYGSAIGTGYSEYAGDELTYKYYLTDTVTPGHEYVIVNSNTAGAAKSLTDINTAISSQNITVENDGTGLFVSPSADSYIWNTTGTEEGVLFANKSSGKFLKAYGETDTPDISLNVTSSDNPFGSNAFMFNPNGYAAKSGYYLGYKSDITVQESTGGTGAAPSGDIMVMEAYTYMKYYNNGAVFKLNTPFSIEFDFAFNAEDSVVCIKNSVFDNILNISNSTKQIYICGDSSNTTPIDASAYLLGGTGYTLWNHCKYEVANGYVTVTLNGHQFDSVSYGSFSFVPKDNNGNDKPGFIMGTYTVDNGGGGNTAYDNFTITLNGEVLGTITDGKTHNDGYMSGGMGADSTDGFSNATLPSNWSNGGTTTTKTYATNVFTASNDSSDKVYFYEKRPVGDVIEVYELVDDITAGETYVLVDANEAGSAKLLASDATASSVTVYSDGISYTPYVLATADREYTVVKAGNGYIFNNINDSFLSQNGLTGSLTADNVLECENGAVTVKGNTYYLYKKTQITKIDTGLASDFAVVDFGTGITVGADDVRAFRNNDTYSDRVDVSLSALVTDDDGLIKNNKFYKYNLASDKLAAANGEGVYVLDKSGVGTLSLTLGEVATLRFVPTSANYETVQTFTYQCTVDRIGAYMYADLKVIPATTIYYEDNREGFITYTNGTYPDAETGAKWEIVDSNSAINTLLGDEKVYGYSDDYTSYLKYSGNSAHKITVTSSQITSGTGWMPTATFTFTGTGFDLISATSGATTLVTLEITNTVTGETKKIAVNSYFGYQYIPADNETGTPASWEPVAKDDTVAMYQVPIVRWRGNYGNYSVKVIPTYNKIMDVAKLGYSDFYLDAVRVYNPVDVSDAANADVKSQYQADKELVSYEANLRRLLIPKDSVIPGESSSVSGVVFTDGNGLTRTVNTYTDYTNPIANNEIIVPAGTGVSFALNAADGTVPERILLGAKVSAGVGTDESVELVVSGGGEPKTIRLGTSTDMYYDITDAIKWNGTTTETITIYNRGIEGKDPHISLTNIKFTSGSETASLSSLNFFVSAAMEADTYKVLAEEFGVELVYGDIDGDGTVNTVDSKLIKKQMLGLIELAGYDYEAGDIDGDGEISSKDVKLLMKMLLTD